MSAEVRERFARIVNDPEEQLDLAEAALLIAKEEQPDLDIEVYLRRLDELATAVRGRLSDSPTVDDIILNLNIQLYREEGLRGDTSTYYDPANSFLNECSIAKLVFPSPSR